MCSDIGPKGVEYIETVIKQRCRGCKNLGKILTGNIEDCIGGEYKGIKVPCENLERIYDAVVILQQIHATQRR